MISITARSDSRGSSPCLQENQKFCFCARGIQRAAKWPAGDHFEPLSAGIEPKGVNPLAVEAMNEIGIDISHQKSKDVVSFLGQYIPYVITLCEDAKERCPIFPRTYKFLHWGFDDPAAAKGSREEKLAVFRRVRDEIARKIDEEFVKSRRAQPTGT